MKWYKHLTDSLNDPFIFDLISRHGGDGYLVFFGTLEIMAREFKIESPGKSNISLKYLSTKLQLSKRKVKTILEFCDAKKRIFVIHNNSSLELYCPKLAELCDQHTAKVLKDQDYKYNSGSEKWEITKKKVRKRDNFCCKNCGKTTEINKRSLDVHHIIPFKKFHNVDEANDINNLVTLCISCHKKAETGYLHNEMDIIQQEIQNLSSTESSTLEEEVRSKKKEEDNKSKKPSCPAVKNPPAVPRKISFTEMDMKLARLLNNLMEKNNPNKKPITKIQFESWANECRLAREGKDKRTYEGLEKVLRWSQDDSFWKTVILSMSNLRDKYDQLTLNMGNNNKQQNKSDGFGDDTPYPEGITFTGD